MKVRWPPKKAGYTVKGADYQEHQLKHNFPLFHASSRIMY